MVWCVVGRGVQCRPDLSILVSSSHFDSQHLWDGLSHASCLYTQPTSCLFVRLSMQFVASKLSHRILEQAREQQDELQEEHGLGEAGAGGGLQRKKKR